MPIKAGQATVRIVKIPVTIQSEDGSTREETLTIKHKPVSDEWLEKWRKIVADTREKTDAEVSAIEKQARAITKEALEAQEKGQEFDLDEALKPIKEARKRLEEQREKTLLVRQLADILIDIDHLDEEDKPIAPTEEFLHTLDRAFLQDINQAIEKKVFGR